MAGFSPVEKNSISEKVVAMFKKKYSPLFLRPVRGALICLELVARTCSCWILLIGSCKLTAIALIQDQAVSKNGLPARFPSSCKC